MKGYIDPRISPGTERERRLLAAIRVAGANPHLLHPERPALRLTALGVCILAADLRTLAETDLIPIEPRPGARARGYVDF